MPVGSAPPPAGPASSGHFSSSAAGGGASGRVFSRREGLACPVGRVSGRTELLRSEMLPGPSLAACRPPGAALPGVGPGGQQAAKDGPGSTSERSGSGRRDGLPTAQARPSRREKSLPDAPPPAADDEEWPDDAGPAAGGAEPTGMELIERQLGGTVIEEIEEP